MPASRTRSRTTSASSPAATDQDRSAGPQTLRAAVLLLCADGRVPR
ncbi:hypothetical protein ACFFX0_24605 [Citricoccus parietis]|uniref:Uncharacterized protein n=1 Tax=Citricoccus parietis TaxID=592307 RepID=A0ABV5G703_9MICC